MLIDNEIRRKKEMEKRKTGLMEVFIIFGRRRRKQMQLIRRGLVIELVRKGMGFMKTPAFYIPRRH